MNPTIITPPSEEPLLVHEVEEHSRLDDSCDAAWIQHAIMSARLLWESWADRQAMLATLLWTLDRFPWDACESLVLPRPPLVSVTSIQFVDADGNLQTWDSDMYQVDVHNQPGRVQPVVGGHWPMTRYGELGAVRITYTAGSANREEFPATAKMAMLLAIGHWSTNRDAVLVGTISKEIELGWRTLIAADHIPQVA